MVFATKEHSSCDSQLFLLLSLEALWTFVSPKAKKFEVEESTELLRQNGMGWGGELTILGLRKSHETYSQNYFRNHKAKHTNGSFLELIP
jgi:hypothetical protein